MASLKELIERQKLEKAASAARAVVASQPDVAATSPPKANGVGALSRIKPKQIVEAAPPAAQPVPKVEAPKAAVIPASVPPPKVETPVNPDAFVELRRNLEYLANNIEQKELVGQVVRTIARQLQENPQFGSKMVKADFNLIVRGLRSAYTVAARKKIDKEEKKQVRTAEMDELEQIARDVGITF